MFVNHLGVVYVEYEKSELTEKGFCKWFKHLHIDVLQAVFGQIVIPQAVYNETTSSDFPSSQFVLQAIALGWLQVRPVLSIGLVTATLYQQVIQQAGELVK